MIFLIDPLRAVGVGTVYCIAEAMINRKAGRVETGTFLSMVLVLFGVAQRKAAGWVEGEWERVRQFFEE